MSRRATAWHESTGGRSAMALLVVMACVARGESTFLLVAADGTGDHQSIQAAVDAAAPGAVIRIAAGEYVGRVRIEKPLTLEGAGWRSTRVVAVAPSDEELEEALAGIQQRWQEAETDEERARLEEEARGAGVFRPVLSVRGADGVTIRGLGLTLRGDAPEGSALKEGFVLGARESRVEISDCAIVGSPASGIGIVGGDVEVRDTLVAAIWSTGIAIFCPPGTKTSARVLDCEVRSCHHRCIEVGGGNERIVIAGCRISGSSWHGIRYDDASPLVVGNRIFDNYRSGIYAAGQTSAQVIGNLFADNDMSGVSCWEDNRDLLRGNTFAGKTREGLAVLETSRPRIERNVFVGNGVAIQRANLPDGEQGKAAPEIAGNLFWRNETEMSWPGVDADDPRIRIDDPGLDDDGVIPAGSLAWRIGAGAASLPPAESVWPPQPEEEPIRAALERFRAEDVHRNSEYLVGTMAQPMAEAINQIQDAERRARAVERMRVALASESPAVQRAGLLAFQWTGDAHYDREGFRELLLPLAGTQQGGIEVFYALTGTGIEEGDLELLLEFARRAPPEAIEGLTHLIKIYGDGRFSDQAAAVVLELLDRCKGRDLELVLHGLWGAELPPAIEARVLEIAREDTERRYDVYYTVLSRVPDKSAAVTTALLEGAVEADSEVSTISIFGLGFGVASADRERVADTLLLLLEGRRVREQDRVLHALSLSAGKAHVERIQKLIDNDRITEELRDGLRQVLAAIDARKEGEEY